SVFSWRVASEARVVTGVPYLATVRVVAIAAGHTGSEHLALLEGAVIVHLIAHLSVGMVEPTRQRRHDVRLGKPLAGSPILRECPAARMTQAASLDFLAK